MAGISASGVGSGLDIASLVTQLVQAETSAQARNLSTRKQGVQAKLSAYGMLQGALSSLQSKVTTLADNSVFEQRSVSSGNTDVFTATAAKGAGVGNHSVEVTSLAQAQRLVSNEFGVDAVVGTGTLTLSVGGEAFSVSVDAGGNTLAGIRDAINQAPDNSGVTASLLNTNGNTRLVLSATKTGLDHQITVTTSGGDGGLQALVYDPGTTENLTQTQAASDAQLLIDGIATHSDTNVIDDVIPGVTLTLKSSQPGTPVSLDVSADVASQRSALQDFVSTYNNVIGTLGKVSRYDPATRTASVLTGDATVRQLGNSLRRSIATIAQGSGVQISSLAALGITTQSDGTLALDTGKLDAALGAHPDQVRELLGGSSGVAVQLKGVLGGYLDQGGRLPSVTESLQGQLDDIADDNLRLSQRISDLTDRYKRQYAALDSLIAQMQQTSTYLTQQLANLPG